MEEDLEFNYSTDAEWDKAGAAERGFERNDCQWILSDRDCWYRNPFYIGEDQPHPED
jgi:phage-related protein